MASANSCEPAQRTPFKFGEYIVMDVLGEGAYGTVARCFHPQTLEVVAVKAIKDPSSNVRNEVEMLRALSQLQPDKYNIVRFINYFRDRHARCLAFETLDKSLDNLIKQRSRLNLKEIRPIAQQLLVALDGLKTAGIIHADLKPDNVMLVNHKLQPYKVKLIDFGLSGYSSVMNCNTIGQPYMFMAPEATLGYKLTEAMDMWSLGCTLGECFTGAPLFNDDTRYNNLRSIVRLLGLPSRKVLQEGEMSEQFFIQTDDFRRFKSPEEYLFSEGYMDPVVDGPLEKCSTLESVFQGSCTDEGDPEYRDRMAFADLMKRLLDMDPETRITPREALHHCFLTMEHLVDDDSEYSEAARGIMAVALKNSTKVSDLSPPPSPNLHVSQAVPEVENPAPSVAHGENIPPPPAGVEETTGTQILEHLSKGILDPLTNTNDSIQPEQPEIRDEPLVEEERNGTQILLCIGGDSQDSQTTVQPEQSDNFIVNPGLKGPTGKSIPEIQINSMDNAQPEKSEPSILGSVFRMSDCMEKGILDLQMKIQPHNIGIVNQLIYIDETSDTQIPESLDRPHITHDEIPEDTDPEDSGSAGTSSSKSSSVRRWCKRAASCCRLVGQSVLSYMVSSSPNITGAVVVPMCLWRRVDSVVNKRI